MKDTLQQIREQLHQTYTENWVQAIRTWAHENVNPNLTDAEIRQRSQYLYTLKGECVWVFDNKLALREVRPSYEPDEPFTVKLPTIQTIEP